MAIMTWNQSPPRAIKTGKSKVINYWRIVVNIRRNHTRTILLSLTLFVISIFTILFKSDWLISQLLEGRYRQTVGDNSILSTVDNFQLFRKKYLSVWWYVAFVRHACLTKCELVYITTTMPACGELIGVIRTLLFTKRKAWCLLQLFLSFIQVEYSVLAVLM